LEALKRGALFGGVVGSGGETLKNTVRAKNAASLKEQKQALEERHGGA
jgi:hypothetical protein